jgi:hypothetical protein
MGGSGSTPNPFFALDNFTKQITWNAGNHGRPSTCGISITA